MLYPGGGEVRWSSAMTAGAFEYPSPQAGWLAQHQRNEVMLLADKAELCLNIRINNCLLPPVWAVISGI